MKHRQIDAKGRSTNRLTPPIKRNLKPSGPFVPHTRTMLESPAWRALSINARRLLDRIELEHLAHGGLENGALPVTHTDFIAYGLSRRMVTPAIQEAERLGFIRYKRGGRYGGERKPSTFRLTYLGAANSKATNEWEKLTETEIAQIEKQFFAPTKGTSQPPQMGAKTQSRRNAESEKPLETAKFTFKVLPPEMGELSISTPCRGSLTGHADTLQHGERSIVRRVFTRTPRSARKVAA